MDLEHDILLLANHVIRNQPVLLDLLNETFGHNIRAFTLGIDPLSSLLLSKVLLVLAKGLHKQLLREKRRIKTSYV